MTIVVYVELRGYFWHRPDWTKLLDKTENVKSKVLSRLNPLSREIKDEDNDGNTEYWWFGAKVPGRDPAILKVVSYCSPNHIGISILIDLVDDNTNDQPRPWQALQWHCEEIVQAFVSATRWRFLRSHITVEVFTERYGLSLGVKGNVPLLFPSLVQSIRDNVGLPAFSTLLVGIGLGLSCVLVEDCSLSDDVRLAVFPVIVTLILTILLWITGLFRTSSKVKYYVDS